RVLETGLEHIVVYIGHGALGLDLLRTHGLQLEIGHGARRILRQGLVYSDGYLAAGSEIPGNQVRRDEFLCCVHASSASICLYTLQSSPSPIFVTRPASY